MSWGIVASVGVGLLSANQSKKNAQMQADSQKKEMDPRMAPYVFGDSGQKGLLSTASDQLTASRSPERMQGWNNMMNRGQQLLGGSVAGNPFSSGYQGGANFGTAGGMGNGLGQYVPQAIPTTQAPAPVQQQPFSLEELMAEWERRQKAQILYENDWGMGDGTSGDAGFGAGSSGDGSPGGGGMGNSGEGGGGPGSAGW